MTNKNQTLKVYTKENSIKWNQNGGGDTVARPWIVRRVAELANTGGKTLLDIGSGTGRWTKLFSKYLEQVVGLDISSEMVKTANETNSADNIRYIQGDILESAAGKYDIITALAMLQHLKNKEELNKVYSVIKDLLNPEGSFLFYVPHPMNVYTNQSRIAQYEFNKNCSYDENFPFTAKIAMEDGSFRIGSGYNHSLQEYLGELIQSGFKIIKMEELTAVGDKIPFALVVDAKKE
jgi:SAM-dependent methyltransferase